MMEIENFTFINSGGLKLAARIYYKDRYNKNGLIFSHGLFKQGRLQNHQNGRGYS